MKVGYPPTNLLGCLDIVLTEPARYLWASAHLVSSTVLGWNVFTDRVLYLGYGQERIVVTGKTLHERLSIHSGVWPDGGLWLDYVSTLSHHHPLTLFFSNQRFMNLISGA